MYVCSVCVYVCVCMYVCMYYLHCHGRVLQEMCYFPTTILEVL